MLDSLICKVFLMSRGKAAVGAGADAEVAASAVAVGGECVAVPQEFYFSDCVVGARFDAFPARGAFAWVEFGVMYCFVHVLCYLVPVNIPDAVSLAVSGMSMGLALRPKSSERLNFTAMYELLRPLCAMERYGVRAERLRVSIR